MVKLVYSFNEGSKDMRALLGGKGANLAEMTKLGLPVPFGFTVTTEACNRYYDEGRIIDDAVIAEIYAKMEELEQVTGKKFADDANPLLVSVRSGAAFSMPGMMDTILNLGLNDEAVKGLAKSVNDDRFAYDSYRRFIQMFSDVVLEIPMKKFNDIFDGAKEAAGVELDVDLSAEDLMNVIEKYKALVLEETGVPFPQEPKEQLLEAVKAVFRSWNNDRAILYRRLNHIPDDIGTAVNIQSMVFGNMGDTSASGVAFTRNPINGEKALFGEFLINAQGEDVVAGIRTPRQIADMKVMFPDLYDNLISITKVLEKHYTDMQDIEFTIEKGKLYMLQTRAGKRTAKAAVKITVDLVEEELIEKEEAVCRINAEQVDQLLHPNFDEASEKEAKCLGKGLAASPGAACGKVYFNASEAEAAAKSGENVILIRTETSPEDLAGMVAADGLLTSRGGMTSHAAVVARGLGKCCVVGCSALTIKEEEKTAFIGDFKIQEGDYISLNGTTGNIYAGMIPTENVEISDDFNKIMTWADGLRNLKVRANADNPADAKQAVDFGAEGIGLCRTEHMFFADGRISAMRKMILADSTEMREKALAELMPFQKNDFKAIFEVMADRPVTIRLLDPPLHEFLPKEEDEIRALAEDMEMTYDELNKHIESLHEMNPMLGHRGCRLAVTYPEIARMQTRAIIEAALEVKAEKGFDIMPEIMIPLVGIESELKYVKDVVVSEAEKCKKEYDSSMEFLVGTMIEIPRAALTADEIAREAEFFSFGTNDLTQLTYGFSRDDAAAIIDEYMEKDILKDNVFKTLDTDGVGKLVETAAKLGKQTRSNLKLGVCGEHGGDPRSIEFCAKVGLNYVSCSPYRVPIARLAAAQAAVKLAAEK